MALLRALPAPPADRRRAARGRGPSAIRFLEEERPQLFQRFFRTTRTRSYGGTGLGLFISKRIAEAHSGRLWLERTGPDGSTFALAIPALRRAHDERD